MGSLRVGHDWVTSLSLFTFMHWRRKWQPTPVCLPGESQGQGSLVGFRLWGRTEWDSRAAESLMRLQSDVIQCFVRLKTWPRLQDQLPRRPTGLAGECWLLAGGPSTEVPERPHMAAGSPQSKWSESTKWRLKFLLWPSLRSNAPSSPQCPNGSSVQKGTMQECECQRLRILTHLEGWLPQNGQNY